MWREDQFAQLPAFLSYHCLSRESDLPILHRPLVTDLVWSFHSYPLIHLQHLGTFQCPPSPRSAFTLRPASPSHLPQTPHFLAIHLKRHVLQKPPPVSPGRISHSSSWLPGHQTCLSLSGHRLAFGGVSLRPSTAPWELFGAERGRKRKRSGVRQGRGLCSPL